MDLSRLIGGPVLNSHGAFDLANVLGVVLDAGVDGREGWAVIKVSERHRDIFADVKAGIIRQVSVGYTVQEWLEETNQSTAERVRLAIKWTPHELSFVPLGADAGATTRGVDPMEETIETTTAPADNRAGINAEIRTIGRLAGLTREWSDGLIDRGGSADEARRLAFAAMNSRAGPEIRTTRVEVGASLEDPHTRTSAIGEALFTRLHPEHKPSEQARAYVGLSIPEVAKECLKRAGMPVTGLSPEGLITRAHTLSDYPLVFADTVGRELRSVYAEAPRGVLQAARQTTNRDFRTKSVVNFGDDAGLEKVNEHGEFKHGTFRESGENLKLDTYGRIYSYTRQMQVNDDLGALQRIPALFARAAREKESGLAVDLLTSGSGNGPTLTDLKALFHADHGNKASTGATISETTLSDARKALRLQTGLSGKTINLEPRILLVPAALETLAEKTVSAVQAAKTSDVNPFTALRVVVDSRLDAKSATRWYVVTDPAAFDGLWYAYLEGHQGPQVESRVGWEIDGVEVKVRLDFGVAFVDYRGWYTNAGA